MVLIKNCDKCGTPFAYNEVRKSIIYISKDNKLICKDCGRIYERSMGSRIIYSMIQNLPLLLFLFVPSKLWKFIVLFYIPFIIILSVISPYFTTWKVIEEDKTNKSVREI